MLVIIPAQYSCFEASVSYQRLAIEQHPSLSILTLRINDIHHLEHDYFIANAKVQPSCCVCLLACMFLTLALLFPLQSEDQMQSVVFELLNRGLFQKNATFTAKHWTQPTSTGGEDDSNSVATTDDNLFSCNGMDFVDLGVNVE